MPRQVPLCLGCISEAPACPEKLGAGCACPLCSTPACSSCTPAGLRMCVHATLLTLCSLCSPQNSSHEQVWRVDTAASAAAAGAVRRVLKAALVFQEPDERFHLALWRSRSGGGCAAQQDGPWHCKAWGTPTGGTGLHSRSKSWQGDATSPGGSWEYGRAGLCLWASAGRLTTLGPAPHLGARRAPAVCLQMQPSSCAAPPPPPITFYTCPATPLG